MKEMKELLQGPPDVKAERVCWGCQKAELPGKKFQQCPQCHQEGFIPAVFCSQKCFKKAWPRHKKWHNEEATQQKNDVALEHSLINPDIVRTWGSEYNDLCMSAERKTSDGEIAGAKKILRKAQKLEPRRPEAFDRLAEYFFASGQEEEAWSCLEEACKRWAFVALTGHLAQELNQSGSYAIDFWANCIGNLTAQYIQKSDNQQKKPNWWRHDAMLKRVTKVALNTYTKRDRAEIGESIFQLTNGAEHGERIFQLSRMHAYALSGQITQGILNSKLAFHGTSQELKEASALFKYVSEKDEANAVLFQKYSAVAMVGATAMEHAEEGREGCTDVERGEAGLWVLIHGLVSPSGLTMNGKFGTVCLDGLEASRVAVKVDGISAPKRLKPKNLLKIPFSEKTVALISTLMEDDQFKYVRVSRELEFAHVLVERM